MDRAKSVEVGKKIGDYSMQAAMKDGADQVEATPCFGLPNKTQVIVY